nr:hypothetical protein [uncultured Sphingobacterium sp.]
MKQIKETHFISIINDLKKNSGFNSFIKTVQNEIDELIDNKEWYEDESNCYKSAELEIVRKLNQKFEKILNVLSDVENLMFMSPIELNQKLLESQDLELDNKKPKEKNFSKKIQKILSYKELRSGKKKLLYKFYRKLGIKACVYCNSQHTIILEGDKKTMRFQADHKINQGKFPMFSITLANLYPTCNNCNHLKNQNNINYDLYYSDPIEKHSMKFSLSSESIVKYCEQKDTEDASELIEIKFKDYNDISEKDRNDNLNKVLHIDKIYENHKDIVANLINKKLVYNNQYLEDLSNIFKSLFENNDDTINKLLFNEMIYGKSLEEEDINKGVFAKLTLDIKNQLDEIEFEDGFVLPKIRL